MGGKKGGNKLKKPDAPPEPENVPAAPQVRNSWEDDLTPEQLEHEQKRMKERQAKADAAAAAQKLENEKREWHESQRQKEERAKEKEAKKWEQSVRNAKIQALKEGVVKAEDWGDGIWWAQLPDQTWKEVQGEFFCTHCSKHLNESTLEPHISSEGHRKKLSWSALPDTNPQQSQARPFATTCQPCGASGQNAVLEDWQEVTQEGYLRCIPCGKIIDESHLAKQDHINRLERWREAQNIRLTGYPEPELPHIAWIPCDENNPSSERWQKCLLCNKWVNDNVSHAGTQADPTGSKEHQKNLKNYWPGDPWYEEHVTQERLKWHPPRTAQAAVAEQLAQDAQQAPAAASAPESLPSGWEAARDPAGKLYYFNRSLQKTQWEFPTDPLEQEPGPPAGPPPLPAGWSMHRDPRGNVYYHHEQSQTSTWELPQDEDIVDC